MKHLRKWRMTLIREVHHFRNGKDRRYCKFIDSGINKAVDKTATSETLPGYPRMVVPCPNNDNTIPVRSLIRPLSKANLQNLP